MSTPASSSGPTVTPTCHGTSSPTEEQRQAMMRIYLSFRHENEDQAAADLSRVATGAVPASAQASGTTGTVSTAEANGSTPLAG
jgi:hypothetical protein